MSGGGRRGSGDDLVSLNGNDIWSKLTREAQQQSIPVTKKDSSVENEAKGEGDADQVVAVATQAVESFMLCVGMPGSGKSTLLNLYLNPTKEDSAKPTVALEYMFARRATAANCPKDVAHMWELGGGAHVSDLVSVPIGTHNFSTSCYVIVVDLSRPSSVLSALIHWTDHIKVCVKTCVRELAKANPSFAEELKRKTYAKFGRDHPDLRSVKPCPIPLIIVANKYDLFKDQPSTKRRVVGNALRFIAHINGASLLYCSSKDKVLKDALRATMNKHLFKASTKRSQEANPEKALFIVGGSDTFEAILKTPPGGTRASDFISTAGVAEGAIELWQKQVEELCGPPDPGDAPNSSGAAGGRDGEEKDGGEDASKNVFPESVVDEARAQRDEALRRYRKEAERRAKLERRSEDTSTGSTPSTSEKEPPSQPTSSSRSKGTSSSSTKVSSSSSASVDRASRK